ncbi:MAG: hypothetical protein IPJ41_17975 [Phycisphaerales bacterium]|nr:hypothetical protein [Phycisphaerales bacterium]
MSTSTAITDTTTYPAFASKAAFLAELVTLSTGRASHSSPTSVSPRRSGD